MDWEKLLSPKRLRETSSPGIGERTNFQRDYDRIVFSKPFRRLQKKTQVFPLPEHDFIHTRLTHSLETSCVGRSLGSAAGEKILERYPELKDKGFNPYDFAAIVSAAALAHDIGNPPFGHSGEEAISDFFRSTKGLEFLQKIPEPLWPDFQEFEGNAMGFRLLTHTLPGVSNVVGGLNLTTATLGAFSKYPCETSGRDKSVASGKKHGFFQSEKNTFTNIADHLGMKRKDDNQTVAYFRHPLAFLVEAADDISYLLMDLEDGCNLKLVSTDDAQQLLQPLILKRDKLVTDDIKDPREQVGYLRAIAISSLIAQVSDVYAHKLPEIIAGTFDSSLSKHIITANELDALRKKCRKDVYTYRKVFEIEAAGFEIIGGLLYEFLNALKSKTAKAEKIADLLPDHYKAEKINPEANEYEKVMSVVQYVAGMTDTYAIETYRVIKGISLPHY